jgi:hypothetical protein
MAMFPVPREVRLADAGVTEAGLRFWRRVHLTSSGLLCLLATIHSALTPFLYSAWEPEAVWFLGTGLGLLLLAVFNLAHIGIESCRRPSARLIRWANWPFALFGLSVVLAVPEPQAFVVLAALIGQAMAGHFTLPGPA